MAVRSAVRAVQGAPDGNPVYPQKRLVISCSSGASGYLSTLLVIFHLLWPASLNLLWVIFLFMAVGGSFSCHLYLFSLVYIFEHFITLCHYKMLQALK